MPPIWCAPQNHKLRKGPMRLHRHLVKEKQLWRIEKPVHARYGAWKSSNTQSSPRPSSTSVPSLGPFPKSLIRQLKIVTVTIKFWCAPPRAALGSIPAKSLEIQNHPEKAFIDEPLLEHSKFFQIGGKGAPRVRSCAPCNTQSLILASGLTES